MMKISRSVSSAAVAALAFVSLKTVFAAEQPWHDGYLEVAQGDVVNLAYGDNSCTNWYTGDSHGDGVVIHGDMNVCCTNGTPDSSKAWNVLVLDNNGVPTKMLSAIRLAPNLGDTGMLTISNGYLNSFALQGVRARIYIGDNGGGESAKFVVKNGSEALVHSLTLQANAATSTGVFDVLEIGKNSAVTFTALCNDNAKPMRVKFLETDAEYRIFWNDQAAFATKSVDSSTIFEGVNGTPIVIAGGANGSRFNLFNSSPTYKGRGCTTGACDVIFKTYRTVSVPFRLNRALMDWHHSGNTRLVAQTPTTLSAEVEDVLPYGSQTGELRIEAGNGYVLDLCQSQKLNGLYMAAGSALSITNGPVTLTFGTGDTDGGLEGEVFDNANLRIVKTGTGTLSVKASAIHDFEVQSGTLVIDGVTLICGTLSIAKGGKVVFVNGGRLVNATDELTWQLTETTNNAAMFAPVFTAATQNVIKVGSNLATLAAGQYGEVAVDGGTLRIGGEAVADRYWQFIFKKTVVAQTPVLAWWDNVKDGDKYEQNVAMGLGRIHLFNDVVDDDVNVVNLNLIDQGLDVAPSSLTAGNITANRAARIADGINATSPTGGGHMRSTANLTASLTTWFNSTCYCGEDLTPSNDQSWVVVSMRLKDTAQDPIGYGFTRVVNIGVDAQPNTWSVRSSADGVNWIDRDIQESVTNLPDNCESYWVDGIPYFFNANKASWLFRASGAVSVATGATLDTSLIADENLAISELKVDLSAGAGTITKFRPTASGVLWLENPTDEQLADLAARRRIELPIAFGSVVDEALLRGWLVYVDGELAKGYGVVRRSDGKLYADRVRGLAVIVR